MNSCCLLAAALLVCSAAMTKAQTNNNATFTAAQASAGGNAYAQNCATCHGPNTDDGEFAPPLKGATFLQKYAGKPVSELIGYITSKMPPGNPGGLGAVVNTQIAAFILQQNGTAPGNAELPSGASQLASVMLPGAPGGRGGRGQLPALIRQAG